MPETTHEGNDPMGAPSAHRGRIEDCPAPECQDRIIEQQEDDTDPGCKFDEGCHRVVPCDPGCATPPPADRSGTGPAELARLLAAHTDSLATTIEGFTGVAAYSLQPGLKRTLSFLKLYKEQLLTGQWTPEMRRLLDQLAAEAQQPEPHSCSNCEGVDPGTCLTNPDRLKRPPMDPVHILGIDAATPAVPVQPAVDGSDKEA